MSFFLTNPSAVHATCLVEHVDGDPLGVRMATSPGSSAVVLAAPWSRRDALVAGAGSLQIAAYILAGSIDLEGTSWAVYNGETINLGQRLGCHARDPAKSFVTSVFILTSRDPLFGKDHVAGLQWLIDARIESTGRAHILRGARPARPDLDAATWIGLERLLDDARHRTGAVAHDPAVPARAGDLGRASEIASAKIRTNSSPPTRARENSSERTIPGAMSHTRTGSPWGRARTSALATAYAMFLLSAVTFSTLVPAPSSTS